MHGSRQNGKTGLDHPTKSDMIAGMFRAIVFFGLIASAFASEKLDVLVNAAASFSATIQQQLEMLQSNPAPADLAEKTTDYAEAKTAYFAALRAAAPELTNIATGKEARPPEVDKFAAAFAVAGEDQEKAADEQTAVLLKRFSRNPDFKRRDRNSTVHKRSKSGSIMISTGSILPCGSRAFGNDLCFVQN
jgi:hypothetical protein